LIAAAMFFGLVNGCPLPTPNKTPLWERDFVEVVRSVQHVVQWPVAWISWRLRVSQQWAVYQAPGAMRYRIWIEGETVEGQWQLLYRAKDPDHTEDSDVIEAARVWGVYDPTDGPQPEYAGFCHWITSRALERHPELVAVRVRLETGSVSRAGFSPSGKFLYGYVHPRGTP